MAVQRLYVLAGLGLALLALLAFVATRSHGGAANHPLSARQTAALESAALARLKLPADFVPTESGGCTTGRCYVVDRPSTRVVAIMPGLMRAAGFSPPGQLRAAEPVKALRLAHWSAVAGDRLVIACRTAYAGAHTPLAECQDAGRVGPTLVNVLIRPYQPCNHPTCTEPGKTEIVEWSAAFPNG